MDETYHLSNPKNNQNKFFWVTSRTDIFYFFLFFKNEINLRQIKQRHHKTVQP